MLSSGHHQQHGAANNKGEKASVQVLTYNTNNKYKNMLHVNVCEVRKIDILCCICLLVDQEIVSNMYKEASTTMECE